MTIQQLQIIAGIISSIIFMAGTISMLLKMWQTHDVDSYSGISLLLSNCGNMLYWFYIVSLPFGPIYIMHSFYTVVMIIMLILYMLYRHHSDSARYITQTMKPIQ